MSLSVKAGTGGKVILLGKATQASLVDGPWEVSLADFLMFLEKDKLRRLKILLYSG